MSVIRYGSVRGFALLELLIVVAVIAILAGSYFNRSSGKPESDTYHMSISRSNNAACLANRAAMRTNIEMFRMNHPGKPVNTENLKAAGVNIATCPDGGAFGFTAEGLLICSKHIDKK